MKTIKVLTIFAAAATLSACGNFEWFPPFADTTPPTVTATIASASAPSASTTIFNNRTTHVPSLPATVTFSADEAATIYYTTDGTSPTTASAKVTVSNSTGVTGPSITLTNTILKFFGIDDFSNSAAIQTGTIKSP